MALTTPEAHRSALSTGHLVFVGHGANCIAGNIALNPHSSRSHFISQE